MALYDISNYSQRTYKFYLDLYCITLHQIFRQNTQIEHFSYTYLRVLFLGCDGRRRSDLIDCVLVLKSHLHNE